VGGASWRVLRRSTPSYKGGLSYIIYGNFAGIIYHISLQINHHISYIIINRLGLRRNEDDDDVHEDDDAMTRMTTTMRS
jgi:hypothetical protein